MKTTIILKTGDRLTFQKRDPRDVIKAVISVERKSGFIILESDDGEALKECYIRVNQISAIY